jgi:hypothetical protein
MTIPMSKQHEALLIERARDANVEPAELLGEILDAVLGEQDEELLASEDDYANGRVHSNADALRQLREHVERIAGPRPRSERRVV